jgi:hypothetical protein
MQTVFSTGDGEDDGAGSVQRERELTTEARTRSRDDGRSAGEIEE